MNESEIAAIAVNSCYNAYMANAWTIATTAKENEVARPKLTALNSLAVVELMAATACKLIAKLLKYIACKT